MPIIEPERLPAYYFMSRDDIARITDRLEQLELQAQQVATSIATERHNLREALRTADDTPPNHQDRRDAARPIAIGDTVRFSSTATVRGGTGEVVGWTNGTQPFLRIRRTEGRGGILRREIVRRKPHTVQIVRRAS